MKRYQLLIATLALCLTGIAGAHPGHGPHFGNPDLPHPYLGVSHIALMALIGVAAYLLHRRSSARDSDDDRR
jgi:hydrogenase/urease accessory protein HupE